MSTLREIVSERKLESEIQPLFDMQQSMASDFAKTPPEREYLTEGIVSIPKGVVGILAGPGGSSKSMLALTLSLSLVSGKHYLGFAPKGEHKVLYLSGEDDRSEMHRRAYRMLPTVFPLSGTEDSFDGQEAEGALKNLLVPNLMGKQLRLTEKKDDIEETDTAEALAMVLEGHHDLSLIILDTGSRFRGGSENDAADTAKFVSLCEQYAEMTGATVLLVTHTNKQGGANQNVIRGSSALVDNARFAMTMEPNDDSNKVKFRVVKNNYGPVSGNVTFERCDDGQLKLVSETEATLEAALVNLGGKEQEIIDFVRQRADQNDPVTIRELCRTHKSLFDLSETKLVAGIEALISKVRLKDVKVGNRRELHPVVEVES